MLEYTYDEAIELLSTSLSNAKERLVCVSVCVCVCVCMCVCVCVCDFLLNQVCVGSGVEAKDIHEIEGLIFTHTYTYTHTHTHTQQRTTNEDLEHLKNQTITVEVNMARLFNHDVKRRKKDKPTFKV
jgi:hypothetical protein